VLRSRQRGQSIIEFGIIAILFTLIMFAIADFGLLLNNWLSVSSTARLLARDAAVGMNSCPPGQCGPMQPQLWDEANSPQLKIPGITGDPFFGSRYCCDAPSGAPNDHGAAVQLYVTFYDECTPGVSGCSPLSDPATLDSRFSSSSPPGIVPQVVVVGTCTTWNPALTTPPKPCPHPAAPAKAGTCPTGNLRACPGDTVVVTLVAAGAQVITPLVRPFFGGPACPDTSSPSRCYVSLASSVAMRFEGDTLL
jgi:hypothetical protein